MVEILALFFVFFWVFLIGLVLAGFIFWLIMLIDAIQRKFPEENDKIIWIIVIVFVGIIGAIIYYFIGRKKGKK